MLVQELLMYGITCLIARISRVCAVLIDRSAAYICQNIAKLIFCNLCNSGELSGSFIPLVIHVCLGFVLSVSVSDVRSHSIIGLYVLLFLQPVRGQSALGWFINNNNYKVSQTFVVSAVNNVHKAWNEQTRQAFHCFYPPGFKKI